MKYIVLGMLLLTVCPALAEPLPEPPPPPSRVPDRDLAPTPNPDLRVAPSFEAQHASVELKMFQRLPGDTGVAFAPGSRFRTPEERKPIQTPGIRVTVPIE